MVSQTKEGIDSLVKKQLSVESLVKKLHGHDCGCTNSSDGDAGDWSAVCGCVVGKSCGRDFLDEKKICTSAYLSESDLSGNELIPAKPDAVVIEHYKDASWAYLTDEAEKEYVLDETMATCGPTTVSQDIHGKGPLTQRL
ncbi:hypothetical protein BgiBS90_017890 [Biomphalaria glabrata]|nr:hypothetical protein BgiBS90_017890 [Biomphalaria glabrata]